MSYSSFWSDACLSATSRPLQAVLDAAYASCGVTVRLPRDDAAAAIASFLAQASVFACDAMLNRLLHIA
jgi:hypothetical protein